MVGEFISALFKTVKERRHTLSIVLSLFQLQPGFPISHYSELIHNKRWRFTVSSLWHIAKLVVEFRDAQDWKQFHDPKNLVDDDQSGIYCA